MRTGARTSYVLVLMNRRPRQVRIGQLGGIEFRPGFYAYVGSGGVNPLARVRRHLKADKPKHWHIDFLTTGSGRMRPVDVYLLPGKDECEVSRHLGRSFEAVKGFGCSDCGCLSHLFRAKDPVRLNRFLSRLRRPASG